MATTMAAKKKASGKPTGKIRSIRIEPAENGGGVVYCDRVASKEDRKAMMNGPWESPKPAAFGSLEEAVKYVADELGVEIGESEPDADDK